MRPLAITLAAALLTPLPALAEGSGGDRMGAGGAFMNSYNQAPYAPRGQNAPFPGTFGAPDVSATASVPDERPDRRVRRERR
jgi:hypothetical protein